MTQLYCYILESWKKVTTKVTITDGVTDIYSRELEKKLLQMSLLLLTHR
jgi:hypothetical protein